MKLQQKLVSMVSKMYLVRARVHAESANVVKITLHNDAEGDEDVYITNNAGETVGDFLQRVYRALVPHTLVVEVQRETKVETVHVIKKISARQVVVLGSKGTLYLMQLSAAVPDIKTGDDIERLTLLVQEGYGNNKMHKSIKEGA